MKNKKGLIFSLILLVILILVVFVILLIFGYGPEDLGLNGDGNKDNGNNNKVPEDTDILITHGPPKFILDKCPESVGCEALLRRVKKIQPKIHCFGHIHEGHGYVKHWNTQFINASIMNKKYKPTNKPIILGINDV